jgi:6-phosphogluconolactonase
MSGDVRVFADASALCRAAADESARLFEERCQHAGCSTVVLSGGHTPRSLYEIWARDFGKSLPWRRIHLFWGDERYVPPDDPRSNFRMVREALLDHVAIPPENVHPMPTNVTPPEAAAKAYEAALRLQFPASWPEFDLIFLGVGPEGHTASLFPDSPALALQDRWVAAVTAPSEPPQRLSLTIPVLNHGRNVFVLAAGKEKQEALRHTVPADALGSAEWPISLVRPAGKLVWFLDEAAAGAAAPRH